MKQPSKMTRSQKAFLALVIDKTKIKYGVMHPDLQNLINLGKVHICKIDGFDYIIPKVEHV